MARLDQMPEPSNATGWGERERRFLMRDLEGFLNEWHSQKLMPLGYRGLRAPAGSHIMVAAELHKHMVYKGRMERSPYDRRVSQPTGSAREF